MCLGKKATTTPTHKKNRTTTPKSQQAPPVRYRLASVSLVTAELATAMVVAASSLNLAWMCSRTSEGVGAEGRLRDATSPQLLPPEEVEEENRDTEEEGIEPCWPRRFFTSRGRLALAPALASEEARFRSVSRLSSQRWVCSRVEASLASSASGKRKEKICPLTLTRQGGSGPMLMPHEHSSQQVSYYKILPPPHPPTQNMLIANTLKISQRVSGMPGGFHSTQIFR